ncbi:uncharacterized protein PADG_03933 [Paracoccidioides brasiliensis Pb18]|uniref:Protein kinase domain-containing protein n=1 Tax=Paracoccidioides brasiliensis (strain Pb18) TaxID=502780 RepID=C1G9J7_PARBD|nr:uncharacterized protein PADG_03933 [Paracoccidioides brasiliensis Pb18]EEH47849.2 hypothetical protein PADG_03933 [Paracoccidioides brasiliensis Pb18]
MTYQLSASYCARYNKSKPPLSYFPGQEFCIHPHTPPAPANRLRSSYLMRGIGKGKVRILFVGPVRIGDQHSAQLVTVYMVDKTPDILDSIPTDKYLVAKLCDPLYFDHEQDDVDPFRYTDLAYSHETAAYRLLYPLEGTVIPKYYGSFTLELPILNKKTSRSIRLILIEKVPGISMQRLNPTNHTRSERQNILKAIVDAESMLYAHDILHRDIHPRNVLVLDSAHRCVVLIDFGYCGIGRTPSNSPAEWKAKYLLGVPISPIAALGSGHSPCPPTHETDGIRAATGTDPSPGEASDLAHLGCSGKTSGGDAMRGWRRRDDFLEGGSPARTTEANDAA